MDYENKKKNVTFKNVAILVIDKILNLRIFISLNFIKPGISNNNTFQSRTYSDSK